MAREVKLTAHMAKFPELCNFLGGITCATTASIHKQINRQWYSFTYCSATSVMMFNEGKSLAGLLKGLKPVLKSEGSRIALDKSLLKRLEGCTFSSCHKTTHCWWTQGRTFSKRLVFSWVLSSKFSHLSTVILVISENKRLNQKLSFFSIS